MKVDSCLKPDCEPAAFAACPGPSGPCSGNQCGRGNPLSGDLTFPCPSAALYFTGGETGVKVENAEVHAALEGRSCLEPYCEPAVLAACPGPCGPCSGNQCGRGNPLSGDLTFPCPSAALYFTGCETGVKVESCLKPYCEPAAFVAYPGPCGPCSGNQCGRGDPLTGDLTSPCPSAALYFEGCETGVKVESCLKPCCASREFLSFGFSVMTALTARAVLWGWCFILVMGGVFRSTGLRRRMTPGVRLLAAALDLTR